MGLRRRAAIRNVTRSSGASPAAMPIGPPRPADGVSRRPADNGSRLQALVVARANYSRRHKRQLRSFVRRDRRLCHIPKCQPIIMSASASQSRSLSGSESGRASLSALCAICTIAATIRRPRSISSKDPPASRSRGSPTATSISPSSYYLSPSARC